MAKVWRVNQSDCSKIHLLNDSGNDDAIWLENTWHEVSPTNVANLPSGTNMLDFNDKKLTLLDGYCTTYFYKGWATVSSVISCAFISVDNFGMGISTRVGPTVADVETSVDYKTRKLQIVRLPDDVISLPDNSGKDLISDLYPGITWGTKGNNWYKQWDITPLAINNFSISDQLTNLPRSFSIDETNLPGYGTDTNKSFYAPELFAPYMYLRKQIIKQEDLANGAYIGGIIVVIGVKKLS